MEQICFALQCVIPCQCLVLHAGFGTDDPEVCILVLFYDPSFWLSLTFLLGSVVNSTCNLLVAGQGRAVQGTAEQGRTKQRVCITFSPMVYGLAHRLVFVVLAFREVSEGGGGGGGMVVNCPPIFRC